jgi:hypothetical protein
VNTDFRHGLRRPEGANKAGDRNNGIVTAPIAPAKNIDAFFV